MVGEMTGLIAAHRARLRRRALLVGLLGLGALASVLLDLVSGPSGLPLGQVIGALAGAEDVPRAAQVIVWQVRLPVALMALLVGAALSVSGAEMQTVLDNPLAEPFTLGVSASAALGAGVAIVLGLSLPGLPAIWGVSANAFLFALGALGLLQMASAVLALVQFVASPDALQQLVFWTMGSLTNARWQGIWLVAAVLALCLPFSVAAAWRLTALRLGAEQARGFGVDVERLRRWTLVRVSLLAAAAVSMVGVIGFVGLAGPHIARLAVGEDHRFLLPASLFTGALLMSLASVASKLLVPGILLPVGIVTSLVGLPVFFLVVLRRGGRA
jgi:iron complex transport system permease protein